MANSDNTDKHRNKLVGALQLTEQASGVCAIPSGMVGYWNDAGVVKLRNADGSDTVQLSGGGVQVLRAHAVASSALAANTYANGTAGVGATLTGNANGAFATIDGVAAALNNIYLVAGEAAALGNGLYKLTTLGTGGTPYVLTRVEEFDSSGEMRDGTLFLIRGGTVNADTTWKYVGGDSPTVGTTSLTFERDTGVVTTNTAQSISGIKTFSAAYAFTKEANYAVAVGASTTAATAGGNLSYAAGAGNTTGAGGTASLTAGAGGNDAVGGAASLTGGAAGGGNRAGGAASVVAGAGAGSAAGGTIAVTAGAGGATGAGGAISVTGGAGGATSGVGGAVTIAGGAGTANNDNGGAVTIAGGAPHGTGAKGVINLNGRLASGAADQVIADPGTGAAIPVTTSGVCMITTAAAETNTLAIPTFVGQELCLICDVYAVGDRVVTSAQAINQAGNTVMTFGAAADMIVLKAMKVGGALRWRVVANDGVALA